MTLQDLGRNGDQAERTPWVEREQAGTAQGTQQARAALAGAAQGT